MNLRGAINSDPLSLSEISRNRKCNFFHFERHIAIAIAQSNTLYTFNKCTYCTSYHIEDAAKEEENVHIAVLCKKPALKMGNNA